MNLERVKPILFVLGTLIFWWLIATGAFVAVTCIPEGRPCQVPWADSASAQAATGVAATEPAATPQQNPPAQGRLRRWMEYIPTPSRRDFLLILSLIAAVWVTKAMVYPYEDLSKPPKGAK
jgi:hypothetical protein